MSTKAATKKIVVCGGNGFLGMPLSNPLQLHCLDTAQYRERVKANTPTQEAASAKQQQHEAGK